MLLHICVIRIARLLAAFKSVAQVRIRNERTKIKTGIPAHLCEMGGAVPMKRILVASLLCGATLSTTMMSISANDLDFSNQLRAINVCQTQWSTQHPGKAITDEQLVTCMKAQGFRFDPNRQIKGAGSCQGKTATDHPDCYAEPPKTRASRTGGEPRSDQRRMFI